MKSFEFSVLGNGFWGTYESLAGVVSFKETFGAVT